MSEVRKKPKKAIESNVKIDCVQKCIVDKDTETKRQICAYETLGRSKSPTTSTIMEFALILFIIYVNLSILQVDVITGRQYTYAQLRDCSASFALRLQRNFKLTKGDVLAICLPNLPEYPGALLGAIEAGLTVTTVNPIYTAGKKIVLFISTFSKFHNKIGERIQKLIYHLCVVYFRGNRSSIII